MKTERSRGALLSALITVSLLAFAVSFSPAHQVLASPNGLNPHDSVPIQAQQSEFSPTIIESYSLEDIISNPHGLAWDGNNLWSIKKTDARGPVTMFKHGDNPAFILYSAEAPGDGHGITWDGNNIWVSSHSYVYKLNGIDGSDYQQIEPSEGNSFEGLTWRDGYLWILREDSPRADIFQMDPDSGNVISHFHLDGIGYSASLEWDPDRQVFWLGRATGSNVIYKLNGSDPSVIENTYVVQGLEGADGLAYDGTFLWAVCERDRMFYKIQISSTPPPPQPPPGDDYEPDNTSQQAKPIALGETQQHSIDPVGDVDWVKFTLDFSSDITVETSRSSGDTEMWLYDSTLNQIAYDDDSGESTLSKITSTLNAGTYYVKVAEYGDDEGVLAYSLSLTVPTLPNQPPNTPSNPSPSDGATNQPTSLTLSWTGGDPDGDAVVYYLHYAEMNETVTTVGPLTSASYPLTGLRPSTTYGWYIVASDGEEETMGRLWEFTTAAFTDGPAPKPDLIVSDISWVPSSLSPGDDVTFTISIKNQGAADADAWAPFDVQYYVDGQQNGLEPKESIVWSLPAGGTVTRQFPWTASTGNHTVKAYVDEGGFVPESNEGNNERQESFTVGPAPKPDLIVSDISWVPSSPSPGDDVTFTISIKNQGAADADPWAPFDVQYYVDDQQGGLEPEDSIIWSLPAGDTVTRQFTWTASTGSHTVKAYVDEGGFVPESDEGNNSWEGTITISPLITPSLTITNIEPGILVLGKYGTIRVTLKNEGNTNFVEGEYDAEMIFWDYRGRGGLDGNLVALLGGQKELQVNEIKIRIPSLAPGREQTVDFMVKIKKYNVPTLINADTLSVLIKSGDQIIARGEYEDLDVLISEKQVYSSIKTTIGAALPVPLIIELGEEQVKALDKEVSNFISAVQEGDYEAAGIALLDIIYTDPVETKDRTFNAIKNFAEGYYDTQLVRKFTWNTLAEAVKRGIDAIGEWIFSPVDILIINADGQRVGYFDKLIYEEIEGSVVVVRDDKKIVLIPESGDYDVKLQGTGKGTMDYYAIASARENAYMFVKYENIPVDEKTFITTKIQQTLMEPDLSIDKNGDGIVDETRIPDEVLKEGNLPGDVSTEIKWRIGDITKGVQVTVAFEKTDIVNISVKVTNTVSDVEITVQKLTNKPTEVIDAPGIPHGYLDISAENIEDDDIASINIEFKVKKSWINEENIDEPTIKLYRYHDDEWNPLSTEKLNEDNTHIYYSSESPGFSTFVVTGELRGEILPADLPVVTILSPPDYIVTSQASIVVEGKVSKPAKWTLIAPAGTRTGRTDEQGNFIVSIALVEGTNTIIVQAEDDEGNVSTLVSVNVTRTVARLEAPVILLVAAAAIVLILAVFILRRPERPKEVRKRVKRKAQRARPAKNLKE